MVEDHGLFPLMLALMLTLIALLEWWRHFSGQAPNPGLYSAVAAIAVAWAAWKLYRLKSRARALRLGRDGERAVAQYLEWFRTAGFFVFHDVPMEKANIDHVLIGPRGIYTIETKTLSKPANQPPRVTVTTDQVRVAGQPMSRNPIPQAKAQARWLHQLFNESRFKGFVQPVVVFPGWFVEPFDMKAVGVWVIEPKALDSFLARQAEVLSADQVSALASALSSYIRSQSAL